MTCDFYFYPPGGALAQECKKQDKKEVLGYVLLCDTFLVCLDLWVILPKCSSRCGDASEINSSCMNMQSHYNALNEITKASVHSILNLTYYMYFSKDYCKKWCVWLIIRCALKYSRYISGNKNAQLSDCLLESTCIEPECSSD